MPPAPRPDPGAAEPDDLVVRLRAAGCVFAEEEAGLLRQATPDPVERDRLADRRVAGEPLELVLGWAEVAGVRLLVGPGVFVPRRRTELMARETVALASVRRHPVVVDLCCGVGAVAAVVERDLPGAEVHAADLDPVAVGWARRNLRTEGVTVGDLYDALPAHLRGRVDVLAANTPYVPSDEIALLPPEARDHEPRAALDGGPDGLVLARRVMSGAPDWLAAGGSVLVETSERQAPVLCAHVAACGLVPRVASYDDLGATVVVGTRPHD